MLINIRKPTRTLFCLVILAFLIRIINFSFPGFTAYEARVAYRASVLASQGKDELGRNLPLLFNSLTDYQLPAVSYITVLGEIIFGKTDFGARSPFIIFGVILIILTYKIANIFSSNKLFCITSALVLVFSPTLIFLSKVPNDIIILVCFIALLFYLLARDRLNIFLIILVIIILFAVSKFAWFIIPPFSIFTLFFFKNNLSKKTKLTLSIFVLSLMFIVIGLYLQVPQSRRSFLENDFTIFSSITIKNGINQLRGEGIEAGWPKPIEVILFNKTDFLIIGFVHWLSNLQPSIYFGQFDKTGLLNFTQMGTLQKTLIIPFIWGLIYLVCKGKKKERLLLIYFIILTFPVAFIYPNYSPSLIVLTLPFMALIIAFGFIQIKKTISLMIILAMVLEFGLGLLYLTSEKESTSLLRPYWIKNITHEIYSQSMSYKTAVSDDIAEDIVTFIEWYNPVDAYPVYLGVPHPYKYRQTNIKNIRIIGSDNDLYSCKDENYKKVFVSRRDKEKIKDPNIKVIKTYRNNLNQEIVYLLDKGICIDEN